MPQLPRTHRAAHLPTRAALNRKADERRREAKPWRKWYATDAWKRRRAAQLTNEPYCKRCHDEGRGAVPATIPNHITPHRGNYELFLGPLESLCKWHHDSVVQREERARGA